MFLFIEAAHEDLINPLLVQIPISKILEKKVVASLLRKKKMRTG